MNAPLISVRDLRFGYGPGRAVLDGVSLDVGTGERLGLSGPNGAGKSTLLEVLAGLHKPQGGSVVLLGQSCRAEPDFQRVRGRVALLFQDPDDQLFCPTVGEDVAFGPLNQGHTPAEAKRRGQAALAHVGLTGFEDRVAHRLSGGEKRLAALAGVLAMEPEVLLLDEPTGGLDEDSVERLAVLLTTLPQAMLVASHDRAFLDRIATRRVTMQRGRLNGCA